MLTPFVSRDAIKNNGLNIHVAEKVGSLTPALPIWPLLWLAGVRLVFKWMACLRSEVTPPPPDNDWDKGGKFHEERFPAELLSANQQPLVSHNVSTWGAHLQGLSWVPVHQSILSCLPWYEDAGRPSQGTGPRLALHKQFFFLIE